MPKENLTKAKIDRLQPSSKRQVFYDEKLLGFGLRVEPTGRRTFFVEYRPGRRRRYAKRRACVP